MQQACRVEGRREYNGMDSDSLSLSRTLLLSISKFHFSSFHDLPPHNHSRSFNILYAPKSYFE